MLDNTRAQFRTATQYKRWIAFRDYFKDIINRQDSGEEVWVIDESGSIERLGEILFVHSSSHDNDEVHIMERNSPTSSTWIVGDAHDIDSGGYYLHIQHSIKEWVKTYKPRIYKDIEYL